MVYVDVPVKNGTSENQAVLYTIFETPNGLVKLKGGTENNISKHIKVPNRTPKSVTNVTISGVTVVSNPGSSKRWVLRYLLTRIMKKGDNPCRMNKGNAITWRLFFLIDRARRWCCDNCTPCDLIRIHHRIRNIAFQQCSPLRKYDFPSPRKIIFSMPTNNEWYRMNESF